ncbi:MAG: chitosanase [Rhizobiales bacterium]|nr:chitosanase [Hyphomicrobiales bacterium]
MMISNIQKQAAQAIVNIFETGRVRGDYGAVTLLAGDNGHLTYGRSQTTLGRGNLHELVADYCEREGARFATALQPYLTRLATTDLTLDHDRRFRALLAEAGDDPAMQATQDAFFDRRFWQPTAHAAGSLGLREALSWAVVYDSLIHGSWARMQRATIAKAGSAAALGERRWIAAYVGARKAWLAGHRNALLRKTVYRMDSFCALMRDGNWALTLPMTIRGRVVDEVTLGLCPAPRLLQLSVPPLHGLDVVALAVALRQAGFPVHMDGVFDLAMQRALKRYQARKGLVVDGVLGPKTRFSLGLTGGCAPAATI